MIAILMMTQVAFASPADEKAAVTAARSWLTLVDAGNYGAAWDSASSLFKSQVTREQFEAGVSAAREPMGAVKSRALKTATYATTLPGAPPGKYVVIQFNATYAKNPTVETITPMLDKDGKWRVAGYYIR